MAATAKSCALCELCFALVVGGVAAVAALALPEEDRAADGGRDRGRDDELAARRAALAVDHALGLGAQRLLGDRPGEPSEDGVASVHDGHVVLLSRPVTLQVYGPGGIGTVTVVTCGIGTVTVGGSVTGGVAASMAAAIAGGAGTVPTSDGTSMTGPRPSS